MKHQDKATLSRRDFLKKAALATVAVAGAPMIIPSSALGRDGAIAPSERINVGVIGLGILGRKSHLEYILTVPEIQVLGLCDVDTVKLAASQKMADEAYANRADKAQWSGCKSYTDFRELLARPEIDAVFVVTPDHWHALITIAAAKAGKDIYCEKPLGGSIGEAKAMVEAVNRYGRILQTGSQQRSNNAFRLACELVRNGRIGKVHTVHVNVGDPPRDCELPPEPVPDYLDWDRWVGPAPWRPYSSVLSPPISDQNFPDWRSYRDFGGGGMCDFGAHHYDIAQWGLGMDNSGPVEVTPPNGKDITMLTYRYANGVIMTHGGAPAAAAVQFIGDKGMVEVNRGDYIKTSPDRLVYEPFGSGDVRLYKSDSHHMDWIQAIKTRKQPICSVETGCRTATVCHIGNICYRLNRPLKWDPETQFFVNDDEANRLITRPMRAPWSL